MPGARELVSLTEYVPKQVQESECLQYHSKERPLQEHEADAPQEACRAPNLVLSGEEVESLLRADDEAETAQE